MPLWHWLCLLPAGCAPYGFQGTVAPQTAGDAGERAIEAAPTSLSYLRAGATYVYNDVSGANTDAIALNAPAVAGTVTGYSVSPDLAASTGLIFDPLSGEISGKPTLTSLATDYTVTAHGPGGVSTTVLRIRTAPGFTVNSSADVADAATGDNVCATAGLVCTLRAAVQQSNAMTPASRVILLPAAVHPVTSVLSVTRDLEIIGAGKLLSAIDGLVTTRIFSNSAGVRLKLSDLTVQNARLTSAFTSGGAILASGPLELRSTFFQSNTCSTSCSGGAIAAYDELLIYGSTFSGNVAAGDAGAIDIDSGAARAEIIDSQFTGNSSATGGNQGGGAIRFRNMTSNSNLVRSSLFTANLAADDGGALLVRSGSTFHLDVVNSTLAGNVTFLNGGAIANPGFNTASIRIINSTFFDNQCGNGGRGGAIDTDSAGTLEIVNTLLLNNKSNNVSANCRQATSLGHNLSDTAAGDCGLVATGDLPSTALTLGMLVDNGGPTLTSSIALGSAAYRSADPSFCPALDQRGVARHLPTSCDRGAFELTP